MSKLCRLVQELCPKGVEYLSLEDIATDLYRGNGITRKQITKTGTPCVRYGEIYTTYNVWFNTCVSFTNSEVIARKKYFEHGDILFAITGESVDEIAKSCVYTGNKKCLAGGDIVVMKHNQNPKYLAYALSTTSAQIQKSKGKVKSKVVHSSIPAISKIKIPLPPLPVQQEIVRILDTYTELKEELEAKLDRELELRKKQYEYYRDKLLVFGEEIKWYSLGDIAEFKYGLTEKAKDYGAVRFIRITDIGENGRLRSGSTKYIDYSSECEEYLLKKGDLIVARTGATFGKTLLFSDTFKAYYASFLIRVRFKNDQIIPSFYWHFSRSKYYWKQALKVVNRSGGQQQFNANVLKKIKIPLPPLEEQKRIVEILDRFSTFTSDISVGLPAEIAARRKQYEYYRDKLLTFEEKCVSKGAS